MIQGVVRSRMYARDRHRTGSDPNRSFPVSTIDPAAKSVHHPQGHIHRKTMVFRIKTTVFRLTN